MKNPFKKGIFYYEISILMFVIMWKHDLSYSPIFPQRGITIGRLYIWRNPYWFDAKRSRLRILLIPLTNRIENIRNIIHSCYAFYRLSRDGFRISYARINVSWKSERYKFWWKSVLIKEFPDIDCVDGHYATMGKGRASPLEQKHSSYFNKEYHYYMDKLEDQD